MVKDEVQRGLHPVGEQKLGTSQLNKRQAIKVRFWVFHQNLT